MSKSVSWLSLQYKADSFVLFIVLIDDNLLFPQFNNVNCGLFMTSNREISFPEQSNVLKIGFWDTSNPDNLLLVQYKISNFEFLVTSNISNNGLDSILIIASWSFLPMSIDCNDSLLVQSNCRICVFANDNTRLLYDDLSIVTIYDSSILLLLSVMTFLPFSSK